MNKELASILRNKIASLPFMDLKAGLAQIVESSTYPDTAEGVTAKALRHRMPVSYDVTGRGDDCLGREVSLVPDSSRKSILYFEDYGTVAGGRREGLRQYTSKIRLVMWLNRERLVGDAYKEITAYCVSAIIGKICRGQYENLDIFNQLHVKESAIPAQNSDLFARYTYDETVRQYLRPPYEFFAIDFLCTYFLSDNCINKIDFNNEKVC